MTSSSCIFINLKKKKKPLAVVSSQMHSLTVLSQYWAQLAGFGWWEACKVLSVVQGTCPSPIPQQPTKWLPAPPQPTRGGVGMALLGVYLKWRVPGCMEVFGNLHPWFEASEQKPKITGMNKTPMIRTKVVWRAREYSKAVFSNQKLRENLITVLKEHLDCTWKENYIYHIPSTLTNGQIEIKIHEFELFSYSFFLVKWSLSKLPFLKSVFY